MSDKHPYVMTIAGFDPSAGAGILADIKTFESYHTYGFAVNTASTVQNDEEFTSVEWLPTPLILKQMDILLNKFEVTWVKIGLIENISVLYDITSHLKKNYRKVKIIWDPILKASAGFNFHSEIDYQLLGKILKNLYAITPNIPEAEKLFPDFKFDENFNKFLKENKYCNVIIKGGHSASREANDIVFDKKNITVLTGVKYPEYKKHGTGCIFSAALIASLAHNRDFITSCRNAKTYVEVFLTSSKTLLGYHR